MKKETIFPLAIGTYGLGASRSESWEDNNNLQSDDLQFTIDWVVERF
jgi:hypothetical protein